MAGYARSVKWKTLLKQRGLLKATSDPSIFELLDPNGGTHTLDLAQWADRDHDQTFLTIGFRWRDPSKVGRKLGQPAPKN